MNVFSLGYHHYY